MFPATTAATAARNVARRRILFSFVFVLKFCYVSLRFRTVCQCIRYKPWAETTPETRRRPTFEPAVCHGRLYVSSRPGTV